MILTGSHGFVSIANVIDGAWNAPYRAAMSE
jgi:hypothetical protein